MYVGLVDDDLRAKRSYPNLELMKLASFHKKNKDLVELMTDYREYERYTKLYLRKNIIDTDLPNALLSKARGKCEYGGYAFTNGLYVPMDNEIEKSLPDVTIYDKIKEKRERFTTLLNKGLVRLQTNDEFVITNGYRRFLVYDKQAHEYPNFEDLVKVAGNIEFIENQYFDDFEKALWFATLQNVSIYTRAIYTGELTTDKAALAKGLDFKVPIHYNVFPEKYADVSFDTGVGIILSYMDKIEQMYRFSTNLWPINVFKDSYLRSIINDIREPTSKTFGLVDARKGKKRNPLYSSLITRIQALRRYKQ